MYSLNQASKVKGVSPSTIAKAIRKGNLKADKVFFGKMYIWQIPSDSLMGWEPYLSHEIRKEIGRLSKEGRR